MLRHGWLAILLLAIALSTEAYGYVWTTVQTPYGEKRCILPVNISQISDDEVPPLPGSVTIPCDFTGSARSFVQRQGPWAVRVSLKYSFVWVELLPSQWYWPSALMRKMAESQVQVRILGYSGDRLRDKSVLFTERPLGSNEEAASYWEDENFIHLCDLARPEKRSEEYRFTVVVSTRPR